MQEEKSNDTCLSNEVEHVDRLICLYMEPYIDILREIN